MAEPNFSAPDMAEPDLTGRQVGHFRLLRRLGQGGMAEVYLAEQLTLQRLVAVKVLKSRLAADPKAVARFQREARAAAALIHPNIVQIYEVGCSDGIHFIAQEYVQGENLRQWLARHGSPDVPTAISIIKQAALALAKAAELGVIHRDIKPENILISRSGEVKITDFGLARILTEPETLTLTQTGMTVGTPLYMSPEQLEGKPLDSRSDIYSLGVTCYQMLSGQAPFTGETVLSLAFQHLHKEPTPLESLCPHLPTGLCRVVHKMLAKSPQQRYGSPQELLVDLHKLEEQLQGQRGEEEESVPSPGARTSAPAGPEPLEVLTQRVSMLMRQERSARIRGWLWRILWIGGILGAFGGGIWGGFRLAERPSLVADTPPPNVLIPQQESALRQWFYAAELNTEEAWQSVIEYFPEKPYLVFRAKQQLARLYLREGRYPEAMKIFEEFTLLGEPDSEMRAYGLAGQCTIYTLEGQYREAAGVLVQLWPIRQQVQDRQMLQLLAHAVQKLRSELGTQTTQEWQQWLNRRVSPSP
jgi:serine/threonine-protein kinase